MPYANWAAVTCALGDTLDRLADHEFLILGEPSPSHGPAGLLGDAPSAPIRYVQVLRIGEVLSAECVGPARDGGNWDMDEESIERLRGLGWLTPEECRTEFGNETPNFGQYVELDTARELPDVLAASLAILGAPPECLLLESSGNAA